MKLATTLMILSIPEEEIPSDPELVNRIVIWFTVHLMETSSMK